MEDYGIKKTFLSDNAGEHFLCTLGEGSGNLPPQGPKASGPSPFKRTYQLKKCPQSWLYVVADCDLTYEFANEFCSVEDAISKLAARGFLAVEVLSCKTLANRYIIQTGEKVYT